MITRMPGLRFSLLIVLSLSAVVAWAQKPDEKPAQKPKTPPLRQVLIAEGIEPAQKLAPVPNAGFVVVSPELSAYLDSADLTKRLAAGENQQISEKLLAGVAQVIEIALRKRNLSLATAIIPPQNIGEGAVRVAVLLGKVRNIKVEGNRWFSESLLREKLRIEQGEPIEFSALDQAISWTNNNPFRHVRVNVEPVPGTGEADLVVGVEEKLPVRLITSYDNSGNDVLGINRYTATVGYGNLWGRDHLLSYQFLTGDRLRYLQAHGLDYRIPLPWRHYLQFSASYLRARPTIFEGLVQQDARTVTSDLRYTIPIRAGNNPIEWYGGLDFKESNNNLAFGGTEVLATKTDTFHFTTGATVVHRDSRGGWIFGATANLSPGHINSRNTVAAYNDARFGADPRYIYGSVSVQRILALDKGWQFSSRTVFQLASTNLLASEALSLGGSSSVRGYKENVFGGDEGFVFSNDLLAPAWKRKLPFVRKSSEPLEGRFLAFYDAGNVSQRHRVATDPKLTPLASTGIGLRLTWATHLTLSADYGWQITHLPYAHDDHGRGHIKVTLAF